MGSNQVKNSPNFLSGDGEILMKTILLETGIFTTLQWKTSSKNAVMMTSKVIKLIAMTNPEEEFPHQKRSKKKESTVSLETKETMKPTESINLALVHYLITS